VLLFSRRRDEFAALAQRQAEETDGNPFFVAEVLRHLVETGAIVKAAAAYSLAARLRPD
jgi:predicted ATPase